MKSKDKFWQKEELRPSFKYAKQMTAFNSKSFFLATKLLPPKKRWATYALYGFCRYVDNLVDAPRNRDKNDIKYDLELLRKELGFAYNSGESENPVIKPFIYVARLYNIPEEYPLDLIKGVEMDLLQNRFKTFDSLYVYCYRVAGVVGLMMTHVLGFKDSKAFYYAEKLGVAMQLANILRDIQEDAVMDRIYLPIDDLATYNISVHDIINSRYSVQMKQLMSFQVERAKELFNQAEFGISLLDQQSQFAISSAAKIYSGILDLIVGNNYNPFKGRVYVSKSKKISMMLLEYFKNKLRMNKTNLKFQYENYPLSQVENR